MSPPGEILGGFFRSRGALSKPSCCISDPGGDRKPQRLSPCTALVARALMSLSSSGPILGRG